MTNETNFDAIDLSGAAPAKEPERQYYYMKKAREILAAKEAELGRKMQACIKTFGCQMNARDSEKLRGILELIGYELTEQEEADFVLYNTCTVRENANLKVYGRLGYLSGIKKKNPHMIIGLCGCMMQEPEVIEKIRKSYRFVDLVFGTHNIYKFAELLVAAFESDGTVFDIWKDTDKIVEDLPAERTYSFKSGVNIMFGCNNFCSYCIVPYVRGRERSRKPEDLIREIRLLVAERQFLRQKLGRADELCRAFAGSRKDRWTGSHPFYDFSSEGSVRGSHSGNEALEKNLPPSAFTAAVRKYGDPAPHEPALYEGAVSCSGRAFAC